jgi:flagellar biosynthesis chaperone FliJ
LRPALRQSLFGEIAFVHNAMNDCILVDELLLQLADYKNDYAEMAAEKLLRKCSTSWEAYRYLQDRVHEAWLPDSARQQVRQIIKKIQVQLHQRQEFGWAYEPV